MQLSACKHAPLLFSDLSSNQLKNVVNIVLGTLFIQAVLIPRTVSHTTFFNFTRSRLAQFNSLPSFFILSIFE